jgi:selenocysteine lyase/cysteine desulfurase
MSLISLRFSPPVETYDGFKFRMASILCLVFGFFSMLFLAKHVLVFQGIHARLLPEPRQVIWNYLLAYYWKTLGGATEFVVILVGFAAVFWLNVPKQYFADRYRDYGKEKSSPEAKSLTLLLTLAALSLVLLSIPFLTLHFPIWLSLVAKYGPIAVGILQYLSILPDLTHLERLGALDKLGWDRRCFDATYRSERPRALQAELNACLNLMPPSSRKAAREFMTQGSVTVTWSGQDALYNKLEAFVGVRAESMTLCDNASEGVKLSLAEILEARRAKTTLVLTTDAEDASVHRVIEDVLRPIYNFQLHTVPIQNALWTSASHDEIINMLVKHCTESRPDIAVLSHVFADTGVVLDLKMLSDALRTENLRTVFVIDGSQAVGNIVVDADVLVRSGYYVFHGHGWLLGSPSVGIIVRNGWLLSVGAELQQRNPVARPFSRLDSGETMDISATYESFVPWFTLNYVLLHEWLAIGADNTSKHTMKLAGLFRDEMRKREIRTVGISGASSAVVITDLPQIEAVHQALESKRLQCSLVGAQLDSDRRATGIRFCFHHYHSDDDVRDLAELIADVGREAEPQTLAGVPSATR